MLWSVRIGKWFCVGWKCFEWLISASGFRELEHVTTELSLPAVEHVHVHVWSIVRQHAVVTAVATAIAACVFEYGFESGRSWTGAQVSGKSVLSKTAWNVHVARLQVLLKGFDVVVTVINSVQDRSVVVAFSGSPTQQALIIVLILSSDARLCPRRCKI